MWLFSTTNDKGAPWSTDTLVVGGRPDTENADAGANVDYDVRVRILEVKRLLFTQLRVIGIVEIVAFAPGAVSIDEMNAFNGTV